MAFVEINPHRNETNEIENENAPTKHNIKLKKKEVDVASFIKLYNNVNEEEKSLPKKKTAKKKTIKKKSK